MDRTIIAIAVVEHAGRYLIGLRPDGAPLAGMWEFPGGKVGPQESLREAAARECWEETGMRVQAGDEYPAVEHCYPHGQLELHFLACRPIDASCEPASRFRWVRAAELEQFEFPAANRALVAQLARGAAPV